MQLIFLGVSGVAVFLFVLLLFSIFGKASSDDVKARMEQYLIESEIEAKKELDYPDEAFEKEEEDAEIEEVNEEENIEETKETEDKKEKNVKIDYDEALSFQQERLPKSRVIINETNSEDEEDKQEVDIASLDDILDDLDLE